MATVPMDKLNGDFVAGSSVGTYQVPYGTTLSRPAGLAILSLAADYWRKWIDPQGDPARNIGVYGTFGRHHSMAMDQRIKAMVKRKDNMIMNKRNDKMPMYKWNDNIGRYGTVPTGTGT